MVHLDGVEPSTLRLSGVRSNHLSYKCAESGAPAWVRTYNSELKILNIKLAKYGRPGWYFPIFFELKARYFNLKFQALRNPMNKETLEDLYVNQNLSQREIAKKNNISQTTVRYYVKKYSLKKNKDNICKTNTDKDKCCPKCKVIKLKSEFYYQSYRKGRKSRQGSWCKSCMNKQVTIRQQKYKQQAIDYKGGKCQHCGYAKYAGALEFHHLDSNQKDFEISKSFKRPQTEEIKLELDKCILLCSNCHREEHFRLKQ